MMAVPTGSGPLEVFRDGVFVRGTWNRSSLSSPLQLMSTSGSDDQAEARKHLGRGGPFRTTRDADCPDSS